MPQQFDRLYINDGTGNFKREVAALPEMFENKSCVRPYDFDQDGDVDLFVGGRVSSYHYGRIPRSYILENDGKGSFKDATKDVAPGLERVGMVTDALWIDLEKDGQADLLVAGDWMNIRLFQNKAGKFNEKKDFIDPASPIKNISGPGNVWAPVTRNDGDIDVVVGTLD